MNRREFILSASAFSGLSAVPAFAATPTDIRAVLLHLGIDMWGDWRAPGEPKDATVRYTDDHISFDEGIWKETVDHAKAKGLNMVVMDIGEFLSYPSHPELGVKGSWTAERLNAEVRRLRAMGLEPIPKLNFSTCHDAWLKEYHRMISTRSYYKVCADVIKDVRDVFETPRFFHLGYDEETPGHQKRHTFSVVRQKELWWHDFLWFCKGVEKLGMRPWIWSDYGWHHPEFVERCPKSVLQSNWYYDERMGGFDVDKADKFSATVLRLFEALDKAGFEQVPCGSNWVSPEIKAAGRKDNAAAMGELVRYCRAHVSAANLKGFMVASWSDCARRSVLADNLAGIDQLAAAL